MSSTVSCALDGLSVSERIICSKDLAEALSFWATFAGIFLAVATGLFALIHTLLDRRQQRWFKARELYDAYHVKCMDYPEFFCGYWDRDDISLIDRERYISFMHFMLTAIEDVVIIDGRPEWRTSLIFDLKPHVSYLRSVEFQEVIGCYFAEVRDLVDQVIRAEEGTSSNA